jgi:hypothetical protein
VGFIDAIISVPAPRCLDDCDEWCAGLPLKSVRLLDSAELVTLRAQVNHRFAWQRGISISTAFVFAGTYVATILFPNPIDFTLMTFAGSMMGIFVVWLLSDSGSWLRRYKALETDLAFGVVHCFEQLDRQSTLEVLPTSEVIFCSSTRALKKWRRTEIIAVAKTPPIASIASEWLQPVQGVVGSFFSGKRSLSSAERSEIRRWAGQVLDHRRRHAVSYVCWAVFLGWLSRWGNPDVFFAAIAFTGYSGSKMCSDLRLFLALKRDADGGVVVINCRARIKGGTLEAVGHSAEFLPAARLKWTDDGEQAEWRRLS